MKLMTAQEIIDRGQGSFMRNPVTFTHALEVLEHCLRADLNKTVFKDQYPSQERLDDLRDALADRSETVEHFTKIRQNSYKPMKKFREIKSDTGTFDLDAYLNGEDQIFFESVKEYRQGRAVSILYDVAVPACDRQLTYMEDRHKEVYSIATELENERRPVRVIAAYAAGIHELDDFITVTNFIVIKDYSDPIFPGIWGAFTNNRSTNAWLNVMQDFFIGTHDRSNGHVKDIRDVQQYFPEDNELIIFGNRIKQ